MNRIKECTNADKSISTILATLRSKPKRPFSYNAGLSKAFSSATSRSNMPVAIIGQNRITLNEVQTMPSNMLVPEKPEMKV